MNKGDFITILRTKLPYNSKKEVEFLFKIIGSVLEEGLKNDDKVVTPIGTFKVKYYRPRRIWNINTKKHQVIDGYKKVIFIPSKDISLDY